MLPWLVSSTLSSSLVWTWSTHHRCSLHHLSNVYHCVVCVQIEGLPTPQAAAVPSQIVDESSLPSGDLEDHSYVSLGKPTSVWTHTLDHVVISAGIGIFGAEFGPSGHWRWVQLTAYGYVVFIDSFCRWGGYCWCWSSSRSNSKWWCDIFSYILCRAPLFLSRQSRKPEIKLL